MKLKLHRCAALPLLSAALAAPALTRGGCSVDDLTCDSDIVASVEAFQGAVDALVKVSASLRGNIALSCANIAKDLGQANVPDVGADGSAATDDSLKEACNLATAALDAEFAAGVKVSLAIEGGKCSIDAEAQLSCEASCSAEGTCDPGSVEVRCEPGELSGSCSAECTGSCTVTTGSVACAGSCGGTCAGDCSGMCAAKDAQGKCAGKCEGSCMGQCTGTCEVVPPSAQCEGSCKGGCSVAITAPKCEAALEPPSCDIDVDCKGGCDATGKLEATCEAPKVKVFVEGSASANLQSTLEANLPNIFLAAETQGKLVVDAAAYVAETGLDVVTSAVAIPACIASVGADIAAKFEAAATASVSVSVSVSASASVGGKASGG